MPRPSQDKDHEPANPLRIPAQADASLALAQRDADAAPIDQCVLHIAWSDRWAGATTVFFLYVVNQIIYADMHGLKPWVHLAAGNTWVYDATVHRGEPRHLEVDRCLEPSVEKSVPGAPDASGPVRRCRHSVYGSGVWGSYFEETLNVVSHLPCMLSLARRQVYPGVHRNAPWAVRAWPYSSDAGGLQTRGAPQRNETLMKWYAPQRAAAHAVVSRYFRPRPLILTLAERIRATGGTWLGVHFRASDKAAGRRRLVLDAFRPYVERFVELAHDPHVLLATDDQAAAAQIRARWSSRAASRVVLQEGAFRTNTTSAVFKLTPSRHKTNVDVLTDIYGLASCSVLLHGFSAVSEAAIYVNLELHERSINLEDDGGRGRTALNAAEAPGASVGAVTAEGEGLARLEAMVAGIEPRRAEAELARRQGRGGTHTGNDPGMEGDGGEGQRERGRSRGA
mmetsp:Transcript_41590/g.137825  ORF Transcript_41590/g.137825 Transcript_41590/m.137825 type:complete len:452 (+) Transcript_41590:93-1448(+)